MMEIDYSELAARIHRITQDVFSTMLGMEVTHVSSVLDASERSNTGGVAALIGFAGPLVGTGCFSCTAEFACKVARGMMMTEYDGICDDVLDAVGEIGNMVIGNLKTELEEQVGPMGLSVPTVIFGRNFGTRTLTKKRWTIVTFSDGAEQFQVQMLVTENGPPPRTTRHEFSLEHQVT